MQGGVGPLLAEVKKREEERASLGNLAVGKLKGFRGKEETLRSIHQELAKREFRSS